MHLPSLVAKWGPLPACWSLERKRKSIKKYGNNLFSHAPGKTDVWDRSVLRDVTNERMHGIDDDEFDQNTGLLGRQKTPSKDVTAKLRTVFTDPAMQFKIARDARLDERERVSVGDVVVISVQGSFVVGAAR